MNPKIKIHVYPTGRLGNQLYFAAIAMSLKKSQESFGIKSRIVVHTDKPIDDLGLILNFEPDKVTNTLFLKKIIGNKPLADRNYILRGIHKINLFKRNFLSTSIKSFPDIQNQNLKRRVKISESNHDYEFFRFLKDDILKIERPNVFNSLLANQLKVTNFNSAIAIHMRFGDFLDKNIANQYGNLDENYYSKAIEFFVDKNSFQDIQIQLFSDDVIKGKKMLADIGCERVRTFETDSLRPAEELIIMSKYSKIIISNSTFSWWAGYLAEDSATIIAPNPLMKIAASDLSRSPNWTYVNAWP
jgi:hypothetical protein